MFMFVVFVIDPIIPSLNYFAVSIEIFNASYIHF